MLKPYYQDEWVTIYHGDCREILPTLEKVDLVLTDPPYVNLQGGQKHRKQLKGVAKRYTEGETVGDIWGASLDWADNVWRITKYGALVFCSFKSLVDTRLAFGDASLTCLITWYKRNSMPSLRNMPRYNTEFIWGFKKETGLKWGNLKTALFDIPGLATGCMATERILNRDGTTTHPTQKPVMLMAELLVIEPEITLDPFMGVGSTLVACKKLNRKCIGIEIKEKYCEIAAKRCSQGVFNFSEVKI